MTYGTVVKINPLMMGENPPPEAFDGRFMIVSPSHGGQVNPYYTAVCIVPPSNAWYAGEVGGIWINQCEAVE